MGEMPSLSTNPRVEPVGEALHMLRMSGAFYCRSELTAPFGIDLPPMPGTLMFHVVTAGQCRLEVEGESVKTLVPGSLGLIPHGKGHRLISEVGTPCVPLFDLPRALLSERYEELRFGGGGRETTMLCGAVTFEHPAAVHLLRLLPEIVLADSWNDSEAAWLENTVRLIGAEAKGLRPGGETIITRLCDVLVIQAIRSWIDHSPEARTGWLGALQDPQLGPAMSLVHRDPEKEWSVESLATESGMSRSAFATRFAACVGESPMRYVTRWRMQIALSWLRESGATVAEVGNRLGYSSEAAFSRAFKRFTGVPPSAAHRLSMSALLN